MGLLFANRAGWAPCCHSSERERGLGDVSCPGTPCTAGLKPRSSDFSASTLASQPASQEKGLGRWGSPHTLMELGPHRKWTMRGNRKEGVGPDRMWSWEDMDTGQLACSWFCTCSHCISTPTSIWGCCVTSGQPFNLSVLPSVQRGQSPHPHQPWGLGRRPGSLGGLWPTGTSGVVSPVGSQQRGSGSNLSCKN